LTPTINWLTAEMWPSETWSLQSIAEEAAELLPQSSVLSLPIE